MAQSEKVKELLRRLEEGTGEIYARYESLIRASDAGYDGKIAELENDYQRAAGQVSAQAKIDRKNTLEKMADAGYLNSGETVQATIAANANRAAALSALSVQKAKDKKAYLQEKDKARASLSLQGEKEVTNLKKEVTDAVREQENLDREFEAQERQRAYEQALKEENLKLEKELSAARIAQMAAQTRQAEQETALAAAAQVQKEAESKKNKGIQPKKTPYEYVDDIIEQNTTYNKKKKYKVIDRKAILLAISAIVKDTKISYDYRYEMYLYGKSLGYVT